MRPETGGFQNRKRAGVGAEFALGFEGGWFIGGSAVVVAYMV
jgi:hypothetical protein